ncbi:hypothetical protein TrST_g14201 [Triparma strigata]|nr:hypothetical protein TrST_g14201 [Triparma strigata]
MQGGFITITAIVSLYLLSVLGVEGNENSTVLAVGAIGGVSMLFAGLINMTMLVRTGNEQQRSAVVELSIIKEQRSVRGISAGELEEGMFGALI